MTTYKESAHTASEQNDLSLFLINVPDMSAATSLSRLIQRRHAEAHNLRGQTTQQEETAYAVVHQATQEPEIIEAMQMVQDANYMDLGVDGPRPNRFEDVALLLGKYTANGTTDYLEYLEGRHSGDSH